MAAPFARARRQVKKAPEEIAMRRASITAFSIVFFALSISPAWAGEPAQKSSRQKSDCHSKGDCGKSSRGKNGCGKNSCGKGGCDSCRGGRGGCRGCGPHGAGLHGRCAHTYEGQDPWFSCGCNGGYKYPVPPQSTYWWPGMYSDQLMTEYHSPWRFPPIKPYTDEPLVDESHRLQPIRPVSHTRRATPKRFSVADKMRAFYNR
jgi:hypothetical protein